jgi:hypothetical protein
MGLRCFFLFFFVRHTKGSARAPPSTFYSGTMSYEMRETCTVTCIDAIKEGIRNCGETLGLELFSSFFSFLEPTPKPPPPTQSSAIITPLFFCFFVSYATHF